MLMFFDNWFVVVFVFDDFLLAWMVKNVSVYRYNINEFWFFIKLFLFVWFRVSYGRCAVLSMWVNFTFFFAIDAFFFEVIRPFHMSKSVNLWVVLVNVIIRVESIFVNNIVIVFIAVQKPVKTVSDITVIVFILLIVVLTFALDFVMITMLRFYFENFCFFFLWMCGVLLGCS